MMKLLLDVGNSRCKCAEYRDGSLLHHPPVAVNADDAGTLVPAEVRGEVAGVAVASVRGDGFNRALSDVLVRCFGVQPVFMETVRAACGVTTAYRNAASLGIDRFLALIGAWRRVCGACVVADCGTAITIDALNGNGVHQGGLIMPGLRLLEDALHGGADRLPAVGQGNDDEVAGVVFARDTKAAIASGCRRMFAGAVGDAMREMREKLAGDATLLATGGDGGTLAGAAEVRYCPHLVIEGLAAFSDRSPSPSERDS